VCIYFRRPWLNWPRRNQNPRENVGRLVNEEEVGKKKKKDDHKRVPPCPTPEIGPRAKKTGRGKKQTEKRGSRAIARKKWNSQSETSRK